MGFRLSYIGVEATDLDAWQRFANLVGFQSVQEKDRLILRMDERAKRLIVSKSVADDAGFIGWEVDTPAELDAALGRLRDGGVTVTDGTSAEAEVRAVARFARFSDPDGTPMELAIGARVAGQPFQSAQIKHGFLTGALGLGHVVIPTTDYKRGEAFCLKYLNASLSDRIHMPIPQGAFEASFLHMNPRHHSVAYVQAPFPRTKRIHHFMVQCNDIEDMGRAYDRLTAAGTHFGMKLGQHTNDRQVSFYAQTPSGFFMEMGSGGVLVDDATWVPITHTATSFWGHERPAAH